MSRRDEEWLQRRREGITSTDIPVILGLSPYQSEAELARYKATGEEPEVDARQARIMRLGTALEDVVRVEEEIEHGIKLRHVRRLITHPTLPWALTSLDFERIGQKCIVEVKASRAARWDDGLPHDIEAQVRWQMGVAGYPRAHIAVLRHGSELMCFDLEHDDETFAQLVAIAIDFRDRLEAGGPFAENAASVKRRYPFDSGAEMIADSELTTLVNQLLFLREERTYITEKEDAVETAIKSRMGDVATLTGDGFRVSWKRTKDSTVTDWSSVAAELLKALPEPEAQDLVGRMSTVRPGFRPFRVFVDKEKR